MNILYPKQPTTFTCLAVAPDGKHFRWRQQRLYYRMEVPDTLKSTVKADFTTVMTKRASVKITDTVEFQNTSLPAVMVHSTISGTLVVTTSTESSPKHRFTTPGRYRYTSQLFSMEKLWIVITSLVASPSQRRLMPTRRRPGIYENTVSIHPNPSYCEQASAHLGSGGENMRCISPTF